MCRRFGLSCSGYQKGIFFDFEKSASDGQARFRRPLLTEQEREAMSRWLISSAPPKSASRLLLQIDNECDNGDGCQDIQISRGPFGAFRLGQTQAPLCDSAAVPEDPRPEDSPQDAAQDIERFVFPFDEPPSLWDQSLMQSVFSQSEDIMSPPSLDFTSMLGMTADAGRIDGSIAIPDLQCSTSVPSADFAQRTSAPHIPSAVTANDAVPQNAVQLLKHYSSTVISLMTPIRHSKTPWHVLFIPHVKSCLAAFALGEQLDQASLCAFYGTLAISAFSLGGVSQSTTWTEHGRSYKQQAHEHAMLMMKTAYDTPKTAKYKSILIGLLTMVQLSMLCGSRDQAEDYFLEAEKLIRLRGLKRKKSRKVRLLHHCYVFERLFYESTSICGGNSMQRRNVREAVESSGLTRYSHDSLSFRLPSWNNLDQEMSEVKNQEVGENDLHLERPGVYTATLYPEIFGVPEPWVVLLSLIIRLGNAKDAAEEGSLPSCLTLKEFTSRAKSIESLVNHLQRPNQITISGTVNESQIDQFVLENMLDAVQYALAIYFYRRIYDVDASMLQEKVASVRDCLLRCEAADPSVVYGSAGFIWPAFIAACEAEDAAVQGSFSNWFNNAAQRSGLSRFADTLKDIRQIWQEKAMASGKSVTWLDLVKKTLQQHLG